MSSLKDIRRRITSVKSTQQVTRAMKLVSAAKLKRAQDNILQARPYAQRMHTVLQSVASRVPTENYPLLQRREEKKVLLVVVTSDRGLCGGFNSNLIRRAEGWLGSASGEATLGHLGKKGWEHFKRLKREPIRHYFDEAFSGDSLEQARQISTRLTEDFLGGEVDAVYTLYNAFKSAGSQVITLDRLFPIESPEAAQGGGVDYIYEPGREELLEALLPRYVETLIHRIILDSVASEHGARMAAMEAATKNAGEMIDQLTLDANRARQAGITKELLEIVGGAEAL